MVETVELSKQERIIYLLVAIFMSFTLFFIVLPHVVDVVCEYGDCYVDSTFYIALTGTVIMAFLSLFLLDIYREKSDVND